MTVEIKAPVCGFEKFLTANATLNEKRHDNSPQRRMVKGGIRAIQGVSRPHTASQRRPGRVILSGRTSRSNSAAET